MTHSQYLMATKPREARIVPGGVIFVTVLLLLFSSHAAFGQLAGANSISFQGALNGADGKPLPDGTYSLTCKFYDVPDNGSPLATTNLSNVSVIAGIASAPIPVDPAWFNGQTRYMEVTISNINNGQELAPRMLITSVPYALHAYSVGNASGDVLFSTGGELNNDQGGSLELGHSLTAGVAPYIDFHYGLGTAEDFNVRLQNRENHTLILESPESPVTLAVFGTVGASDVNVDGLLFAHDLAAGYGASISGEGHVELGVSPAKNIAPPYIDLHYPNDRDQDFNVRLINDSDGLLTIYGEQDIRVQIRGLTQTKVLQITGGSDLAEPFEIGAQRAGFQVLSGMVMVIDREHDGKIVPCVRSYDQSVAGVISGANGLSPGLVMKAEGQPHATGEQPLAMTGRVWCWADASADGGGPIKRGDQLTTSSTLGHAMKVTDHNRAPGAVIGKAMTELSNGKGLVLVLVNLQ